MKELIRDLYKKVEGSPDFTSVGYLELAIKLADQCQDFYNSRISRFRMVCQKGTLVPEKALVAYGELDNLPMDGFWRDPLNKRMLMFYALNAMVNIVTVKRRDILAFQKLLIEENRRHSDDPYYSSAGLVCLGYGLGMPKLSDRAIALMDRGFHFDDGMVAPCLGCMFRENLRTQMIAKSIEANLPRFDQARNRIFTGCNPGQFIPRHQLYWLAISEPTPELTRRMERLFQEVDLEQFRNNNQGEFLRFWSATLLDKRRWPASPISEATGVSALENLLSFAAKTRDVFTQLEAALSMASVLFAFGRLGRTSIPLTLHPSSPYPRFGHEVPVVQAYDTALAQTRAIAGRLDARSGNQFHSNHVERVLGSLKAIPVEP